LNKIETLVKFPLQHLNLSGVVKGPQDSAPASYELFAVSEHMGGLGGGHYTAVVRTGASWFACDDTRVTQVSGGASPEQGVITPNAYVLFYQRKAAPAKWAGMKPSGSPPNKPRKA